jgi:cell division septal protein FtsQ
MFKRSKGTSREITGDFKNPQIIAPTKGQERPKVKINYRPVKVFVYLAIAAIIFYFLFLSSFFQITNVEVEGVKSLEISDYVKTNLVGKNILTLRTGRFLADLNNKFPVLEEARIVRGLPATVKVTVVERKQSFIWCNTGSCYEVDNNGYIYQSSPRPTDKIVLNDTSNVQINLADKVASREFIAFFLSAIEEIDKLGLRKQLSN